MKRGDMGFVPFDGPWRGLVQIQRMKGRTAAIALAIVSLTLPAARVVPMDTCRCCPQAAEAPCESAQAPSESMAAMPCCTAAPATPPSSAKPLVEAPVSHPLPIAMHSSTQTPARSPLAGSAADLAVTTSPLRLSVVLLI